MVFGLVLGTCCSASSKIPSELLHLMANGDSVFPSFSPLMAFGIQKDAYNTFEFLYGTDS